MKYNGPYNHIVIAIVIMVKFFSDPGESNKKPEMTNEKIHGKMDKLRMLSVVSNIALYFKLILNP
jgi:hypothetical protein